MIQFNAQFIRNYLKPFIQQVLTDMSVCEKNGEPLYLIKILNQNDLSTADKSNFERDYFQGAQPANRPFMSKEDALFRQYFMDDLTGYVRNLIRLSTEKGMREAILPDSGSGRTFGGHQRLTKNLNDLAIRMARSFEKRHIAEKLEERGELTAKNKNRIESNELKIVEIDGEEQVKSEEEIVEMARTEPQKEIIPMIEPETEKQIAALPIDDKGEEKPAPPEKKPVSAAKVKDDFDNAKVSGVRDLLLQSGLEIVGELTMQNGVVSGTIRDVENQELRVSVDTKKPAYSGEKFIFEFTESGPHPELKGRRIPVSQADLPSTFFVEAGQRRPAEQVFREHDARGTMVKEKFVPLPMERMPIGMPAKGAQPPPEEFGTRFQVQKPMPKAEKGVELEEKVGGAVPNEARIKVVGLPIKHELEAKPVISGLREKVRESRLKGPQAAAKPTVMEKKNEMENRRFTAEERAKLQGPQPRVDRRPEAGMRIPPPAAVQKRGMPALAKFGIGVGGGAVGLIFGGLYQVATANAQVTELAMKTALSYLGSNLV